VHRERGDIARGRRVETTPATVLQRQDRAAVENSLDQPPLAQVTAAAAAHRCRAQDGDGQSAGVQQDVLQVDLAAAVGHVVRRDQRLRLGNRHGNIGSGRSME
jgi:hypothetical protein